MSFTSDDLSKIILASGLTSDEVSKALKSLKIPNLYDGGLATHEGDNQNISNDDVEIIAPLSKLKKTINMSLKWQKVSEAQPQTLTKDKSFYISEPVIIRNDDTKQFIIGQIGFLLEDKEMKKPTAIFEYKDKYQHFPFASLSWCAIPV